VPSNRAMHLMLLAALAAGGCNTQGIRPYASMPDTAEARRVADLVVEGEVAETQPVRRMAVSNAAAAFAGQSNIDCITQTRVSLNVVRVLKGPPGIEGQVSFMFYSPCYAMDPTVLMNISLPPILRLGDPLRVYVVNRGGQWWLIAHERWYRHSATAAEPRRRPMSLPGAQYPELPSEVVPAPSPPPALPAVPPRPPDIITPSPTWTPNSPDRWWPPPKRR